MADQLVLVDATLASESRDHDRCGGKDSTSVNAVVKGDATPIDTAQWSLSDDSFPNEGSDALVFDTMASWTLLPLTEQVVQLLLDAVRYNSNYARTVTTRICLHYINSIRTRVSSNLIGYLLSVDGCTSSDVEDTGRCDIYYCQPHVYEVQITQKAIGSTVFMVQSIYQTIDQKSLDEMRSEESNLDFYMLADAVTTDTGTDADAVIQQDDVPPQNDQPLAWQGDSGGSEFFGDEEPIAWADDVNNFWESQPAVAEHVTAQTISLRAEPSAADQATGSDPGAELVAVVGIAVVAVSTIAFVLALAIARFRARANAAKSTMNREYSPLRSTLNTAENTISMTSRDSIAVDAKPVAEKVEYFS
ncbi:SAP domain-containing ribonucleoprotein [Phytophthora cinnamomi]|uniref:SAP domain-containing ribonucleoprotein n=1 Tax=Phytophthora cinnamomi TaxID=4785 RepID=UPI00355A0861|nr:SAP domain-containing ribonucleoprotein [Phytophthora cinnamomi]